MNRWPIPEFGNDLGPSAYRVLSLRSEVGGLMNGASFRSLRSAPGVEKLIGLDTRATRDGGRWRLVGDRSSFISRLRASVPYKQELEVEVEILTCLQKSLSAVRWRSRRAGYALPRIPRRACGGGIGSSGRV